MNNDIYNESNFKNNNKNISEDDKQSNKKFLHQNSKSSAVPVNNDSFKKPLFTITPSTSLLKFPNHLINQNKIKDMVHPTSTVKIYYDETISEQNNTQDLPSNKRKEKKIPLSDIKINKDPLSNYYLNRSERERTNKIKYRNDENIISKIEEESNSKLIKADKINLLNINLLQDNKLLVNNFNKNDDIININITVNESNNYTPEKNYVSISTDNNDINNTKKYSHKDEYIKQDQNLNSKVEDDFNIRRYDDSIDDNELHFFSKFQNKKNLIPKTNKKKENEEKNFFSRAKSPMERRSIIDILNIKKEKTNENKIILSQDQIVKMDLADKFYFDFKSNNNCYPNKSSNLLSNNFVNEKNKIFDDKISNKETIKKKVDITDTSEKVFFNDNIKKNSEDNFTNYIYKESTGINTNFKFNPNYIPKSSMNENLIKKKKIFETLRIDQVKLPNNFLSHYNKSNKRLLLIENRTNNKNVYVKNSLNVNNVNDILLNKLRFSLNTKQFSNVKYNNGSLFGNFEKIRFSDSYSFKEKNFAKKKDELISKPIYTYINMESLNMNINTNNALIKDNNNEENSVQNKFKNDVINQLMSDESNTNNDTKTKDTPKNIKNAISSCNFSKNSLFPLKTQKKNFLNKNKQKFKIINNSDIKISNIDLNFNNVRINLEKK